MEIEYKQPKLKDKLYGEMRWEDWDEDNHTYWFARIKDETGNDYEVLIHAQSPVDFLSVAATHSTYKKIIENLDSIRGKMMRDVMENSRRLFQKKRQRILIGSALERDLKLFSIMIYGDLSSEIKFWKGIVEDREPENAFYALLDPEGNLIEAGIEEL